MDDQLERRVAALERALTDGEGDAEAFAEGAARAERVADLADRVAELEDRVAELDAATQALRGYVGEVRAVNEEVEQRADLALSKAESLADAGVGQAGTPESEEPPETARRKRNRTGSDGGEDGRDRCDRCGRTAPTPAGDDRSGSGVEAGRPARTGSGGSDLGEGASGSTATGETEPGALAAAVDTGRGTGAEPTDRQNGRGPRGGDGEDGPLGRLRRLL